MAMAMTTFPMGRTNHDFSRNPLLVYWEMTQACGLACKHCRAEAMPHPHPLELTTNESRAFLNQLLDFGDPLPHLILTGGDPLRRTDIFQLIDYARGLGLDVSITPSATYELTTDAITRLKIHGIQSLGLSLDGSSAEKHDAIRAVPGTFDRTIAAARFAGELGLPIQVNTLVAEETVEDLPAIYELLCSSFPVMRWSLFFLISVGRGKALNEVSPEEGERIMNWVLDLVPKAPFAVKTTEAPSYRRLALDRMRAAGVASGDIKKTSVYQGFQIRDGHGIVFISNLGDIYPSGFLPLRCGTVRANSLADVYRNSEIFRALHSPSRFHGKCGECEYSHICGGSRARAFAHTADALGSDPFCPYRPGKRGEATDKTPMAFAI
ncbi:MAG TPA: TIGR04053 family radical SAM/SPASM domain-containing protein [Candidatus Angelobacter sp.]|nr:TIGR04053 family radical SAM/SPASM domain-containing protein [Candidatus Angelobacter sp.]